VAFRTFALLSSLGCGGRIQNISLELAGEAGRESFGVLEGFGVLGFWREFLGLFCAKQ
jgi:hypothetical protein